MKMSLTSGAVAVILLIAVVVGYSTFFTVGMTSDALVVRLGRPVRIITQSGLNMKVPFVDSVIYIDKRLLTVESPAQEVIASSSDNAKKNASEAGERLVVDAFARYRIVDPLKFYQTIGPAGADSQLSILLDSTIRRVLGAATLNDVVRDKREALMADMRDDLEKEAQQFGIKIADVRIRRADLPDQNSEAVYKRMISERQREAAEYRAEGAQEAQKIRATADREATVIVADANSQAQILRGQGDGDANAIYAAAYGQDPKFFAFYRSMRAYEKSMKAGNTHLVLGPNLDFFRYFGNPDGQSPPAAASAATPTSAAAAPTVRADPRTAATAPGQ